jgi:hypothetical protein
MAKRKTVENGQKDKMPVLSFSQIVEIEDIRYEEIPVPEWNGSIRIGSLMAEDLTEWMTAMENPELAKTAFLRLLALSICNEDNSRLDKNQITAAVGLLQKKDANVINRLVKRVRVFNGLDDKSLEARKNASGEADSNASPIDSRSPQETTT